MIKLPWLKNLLAQAGLAKSEPKALRTDSRALTAEKIREKWAPILESDELPPVPPGVTVRETHTTTVGVDDIYIYNRLVGVDDISIYNKEQWITSNGSITFTFDYDPPSLFVRVRDK